MRICKNCGKELSKNQKNNVFCCSTCSNQYRSKETIRKWEENSEPTKSIPRAIRKYLIEQAGYKCEKCGWGEINESTGCSPLEIHHIDGNWTNNKRDNLQVLCPNCHSLTPNYKALNCNGRKDRLSTKKMYCIDCGAPIRPESIRCKKCNANARKTTKPITKDLLKELVRNSSFDKIGEKYGVTGNAIKKWCVGYGIPHRKKDIMAFSEEDWDMI